MRPQRENLTKSAGACVSSNGTRRAGQAVPIYCICPVLRRSRGAEMSGLALRAVVKDGIKNSNDTKEGEVK